MPFYQVELFRTVHDQAITTVMAKNSQEAHSLAGQQVDDLDWQIEDENITFGSTIQIAPQGYTSMASVLAQMESFSPPETSISTPGYTPLVTR